MKKIFYLALLLLTQSVFAADIILRVGEIKSLNGVTVSCGGGTAVDVARVVKYCTCEASNYIFGDGVSVQLVLNIISNDGETIKKDLYGMSSNSSSFLLSECENKWMLRYSGACN